MVGLFIRECIGVDVSAKTGLDQDTCGRPQRRHPRNRVAGPQTLCDRGSRRKRSSTCALDRKPQRASSTVRQRDHSPPWCLVLAHRDPQRRPCDRTSDPHPLAVGQLPLRREFRGELVERCEQIATGVGSKGDPRVDGAISNTRNRSHRASSPAHHRSLDSPVSITATVHPITRVLDRLVNSGYTKGSEKDLF